MIRKVGAFVSSLLAEPGEPDYGVAWEQVRDFLGAALIWIILAVVLGGVALWTLPDMFTYWGAMSETERRLTGGLSVAFIFLAWSNHTLDKRVQSLEFRLSQLQRDDRRDELFDD